MDTKTFQDPILLEPEEIKPRRFRLGLPGKLLLLTVAFGMMAEILIFVPSIANYRRAWLMQRVVAAKVASLALEAAGSTDLPDKLRQELLTTAGVHAVSLKRADFRRLVLGMPHDVTIAGVYDLRTEGFGGFTVGAIDALFAKPGRLIRVIAFPDMMPGDEVDLVIDETPLKAALWTYADNIFWLSLLISVITAACVYVALVALLVRPMMRLTKNMVLYREDPENPTRVIVPSGRSDEIGIAEKELSTLQQQLAKLLKEKARLANVGLAVSKINHDLRNILSSAQLVSDRLTAVEDPTVKRFAPRLIRALDRAIELCGNTLQYGRSEEAAPRQTRFFLHPLAIEVLSELNVAEADDVAIEMAVPGDIVLFADREHLFRTLSNLIRNSLDALRQQDLVQNPQIHVSASQSDSAAIIKVADNGPGIPSNLKASLFKAFQTAKAEGNGLGLVISAELIRANGGQIQLEDGQPGAVFVITLPRVEEQKRGRLLQGPAEGMLAQGSGRR